MSTQIDFQKAATEGHAMLNDAFCNALQAGLLHPDPTRIGAHLIIIDATQPFDGNLDAVTLIQRSYNPLDWQYPFDRIARGKARISWRTKLSSREVVELHPELLLPGDTKYAGAVYYHGIVAAISGLKDWWDEAWAMTFAAAVHANVLAQMKQIRSNDQIDFIGQQL